MGLGLIIPGEETGDKIISISDGLGLEDKVVLFYPLAG